MAQLLIKEDYLKATTPMGDHVDMKVLTPVIEWVQDIYLRPLLGQDLYELILTQSTPTTTLTAANSTLLNEFILKIGRFYVMAEAIRTMKYRYTNGGVMITTSQNGSAIPNDEMETLIDDWKSKAERYGEMMINYIWENHTSYPTYWTASGVYRERPMPTAYQSPLSFGTKKEYLGPNDAGDFRYRT
jgi:hypothetical protein